MKAQRRDCVRENNTEFDAETNQSNRRLRISMNNLTQDKLAFYTPTNSVEKRMKFPPKVKIAPPYDVAVPPRAMVYAHRK